MSNVFATNGYGFVSIWAVYGRDQWTLYGWYRGTGRHIEGWAADDVGYGIWWWWWCNCLWGAPFNHVVDTDPWGMFGWYILEGYKSLRGGKTGRFTKWLSATWSTYGQPRNTQLSPGFDAESLSKGNGIVLLLKFTFGAWNSLVVSVELSHEESAGGAGTESFGLFGSWKKDAGSDLWRNGTALRAVVFTLSLELAVSRVSSFANKGSGSWRRLVTSSVTFISSSSSLDLSPTSNCVVLSSHVSECLSMLPACVSSVPAYVSMVLARVSMAPAWVFMMSAHVSVVPVRVYVVPTRESIVLARVSMASEVVSKVLARVSMVLEVLSMVPARASMVPARVSMVPACVSLVPARVSMVPARVFMVPAHVSMVPAHIFMVPARVSMVPALAVSLYPCKGDPSSVRSSGCLPMHGGRKAHAQWCTMCMHSTVVSQVGGDNWLVPRSSEQVALHGFPGLPGCETWATSQDVLDVVPYNVDKAQEGTDAIWRGCVGGGTSVGPRHHHATQDAVEI